MKFKIQNLHALLLFLFLMSIVVACASSNEEQSIPIASSQPQEQKKLDIALNMAQLNCPLGTPITLRFLITNNNKEAVTFCKLNSPANERVWTDCFRIKDAKGKLIPYIGAASKHTGPATQEDMITIEAGGMRIYTIDVRTLYQLDQPGKYSIAFVGDKVNLLPASLPANFNIQ